MTSRLKIRAISKSAHKHACAVLLKTGKTPPGVMIAEGEREEDLRRWVDGVKDYRLLRLEAVDEAARLKIEAGEVEEMGSMKELSAYLNGCGALAWWTENMGFARRGG
ncbi:MAG: hypothetical protein Q9211_003841 [Gyalolechia sp. 1 TL-2023]